DRTRALGVRRGLSVYCLLLRLSVRRCIAQVRDHIRDVRELLLEVALVALQPFEQLLAIGEASAEQDPRAAPAVAMVVVHVTSLPRNARETVVCAPARGAAPRPTGRAAARRARCWRRCVCRRSSGR